MCHALDHNFLSVFVDFEPTRFRPISHALVYSFEPISDDSKLASFDLICHDIIHSRAVASPCPMVYFYLKNGNSLLWKVGLDCRHGIGHCRRVLGGLDSKFV